MEDGAEPQQLLPEGAAPAVATEGEASEDVTAPAEETSADLDPVVDEETGPDVESAFAEEDGTGSPVTSGSVWDVGSRSSAYTVGTVAGDDANDIDPVTYGENGSYVYEDASSSVFENGSPYLAGNHSDAGYNIDMSPAADEAPSVPPYPAELPGQPITAAGPAPSAARLSRGAKAVGARLRGPSAPARRANLVLDRLEPWSVMKFSFLISLVAWVVLFVAVALLYYALSAAGVFRALGQTLASVSSSQGSGGIDLSKWTSASRVLGYTMLIGAVDIILITALCTIGAMVYNLVSHLGGGIEITLKEAD